MKNLLKSLSFLIFPLAFIYLAGALLSVRASHKPWSSKNPLFQHKNRSDLQKTLQEPHLTFYLNSDNQWISGPDYSKKNMHALRTQPSSYPFAAQVLKQKTQKGFLSIKICSYSIYKMHELKELLAPLASKTLLLFCRQDAHSMFSEDKWFKEISPHRALVFHQLNFLKFDFFVSLAGDFLLLKNVPFLNPKDIKKIQDRKHLTF